MAALSQSQVWLVFRNPKALRKLYPLLEAQDPQLLQSVDAGQPLLFQPDEHLPLWVISDFVDDIWAEVLAGQKQLEQWLVLDQPRAGYSQAHFLDLSELKTRIAASDPGEAVVSESGSTSLRFDHRLSEGEWLICRRHDTVLLQYDQGWNPNGTGAEPPLGQAVDSWLIPAGDVPLRACFDRAEAGRPLRFRALRWIRDDERRWVDVHCTLVPEDNKLLQCHLVDRGGEVRLESGLSLLSRGTQLGTLVQMQQLLSELCDWAEADYAAVLVEEKKGLAPELLAEAGPIRPGESQWIHLTDLLQHLHGNRLELPERAELQLPNNSFVAEHGLESVLVQEIEQEKDDLLAVLILAAREPMPDWKNLVRLVSILSRILGQELNIQALRNRMHHQQTRDRLTGLPDQVGLIQALHDLADGQQQAGLLLMQIDGMETLQQAHTQEELDMLFLQLGRVLAATENSRITLYRPLEAGFALLLQGHWQQGPVSKLAKQIQQRLERGVQVPGVGLLVLSASMGFVAFPEHAERPRELMRRAQLVVNEARRLGGGRCVFYNQDLGRVQLEKGRLLKDLPTALELEQFQLHYQPKVDAQSEDMIGVEALVRWQHPELGMISPAVFIPLAEESEWIVELGAYILKKSCCFLRSMNERFSLRLSVGVNVAQRQLLEEDFLSGLKKLLDATGLEPELLDVEVTETQRLLNQDGVQQALKEIRALGCTVAIDDFGTGQSTLEDLRKIPADHVKLDQSFVRNIGIDPHDEAIIKATVEMCHELGLHLVAEGVETEEQMRFLKELGCETLQGYLFSKPLPEAELVDLLERREAFIRQASEVLPDQDRQWI